MKVSTLKKILIVASVVSFIEWFNKENVDFLSEQCSCEVHIACNFDYTNDTDPVRTKAYIDKLITQGIVLHNLSFARSPLSFGNVSVYWQLRKIIETHRFDLIHCHTPTASVITRLAARNARKNGSVVMYTCHGFHFHKASPLKNWIIYYPVEKYLSRFCDYLVTINQEDFSRAKQFHCKNVRYIPSVGVDIQKIQSITIDKAKKRASIGVTSDCFLIISAGELIPRKNHEVIIRALAQLNNPNIYYAIAGKGPLKEYLESLSEKLGVENHVKLLGFRTDIFELYHASDLCAFPSKIEGLGMAGIEAMAAGIPLISSNVHGITDYVRNGETGFSFSPSDTQGFANAIEQFFSNPSLCNSMSEKCCAAVQCYELNHALEVMWSIYTEILSN